MKTHFPHAAAERIRDVLKRLEPRRIKIRFLAMSLALIVAGGAYWRSGERWDVWNAQLIDRIALMGNEAASEDVHYNPPVLSVDSIFYFDRSYHAQVISNLAAMDVSAQVTDFIFNTKVDSQEDGALIQATQAAGNVYFGMSFGALEKDATTATPGRTPEVTRYMDNTKWQVPVIGDPTGIYTGTVPRITYPELSAASRGIGFIDVMPDADGVIRRAPLLVRYGDAFYPSLAFRVVCDSLGLSPNDISIKPGQSIALKNHKRGAGDPAGRIVIPIDERGNMLLNFAAVKPQIKKYSYREIIQASRHSSSYDALKTDLAGKIVILSETVEKPYKIRSFRPETSFPMVAIHKAVIQNIITGSYLISMPGFFTWMIVAVLLATMVILSMGVSSLILFASSLLLAAAYGGVGVISYHAANLVFHIVQPLFVLSVTLTTLSVGMGIEKAMRSAETERAKRKAEHELKIGREIQSGFFPTRLPVVHNWEVNVHFQAARYVAGDFYDIFKLGHEGRIGIVTADVCDKGVGAALFMALFRSFIRVLSGRAVRENFLDSGDAAGEVLLKVFQSINNYISITHEQAAMFATVFYGILDAETGELRYINGGHEPPVIVTGEKIKALLNPTGPAVGLRPDQAYELGHTIMDPGDTLVVYSDGVIDALDKAGHPFTKKRFHKLLRKPVSSARELIEGIKDQVSEHIRGVDQYDDITVTVIRRQRVLEAETKTTF